MTGGTGFFGSAISYRLKLLGHHITAAGRNEKIGSHLEQQGIVFLKLNIEDTESSVAACKNQDIVVHCASKVSPWGNYVDFYKSNVIGTQNIIEGCQKYYVKRLIAISTPSVYFDGRDRLAIKESDALPTEQFSFYAKTKLEADVHIANAFHSGLEVISLRPRGVFGPSDSGIFDRILKIARSGFFPIFDRGRSLVDLTVIDNAVSSVLLCLEANKICLGRIYNITNGEPLPMAYFLRLLFEKMKLKVRRFNIPSRPALIAAGLLENVFHLMGLESEPPFTKYSVGLMARSQTLDITRAKTDLGYKPQISLADGLDQFTKYLLSQHRSRL